MLILKSMEDMQIALLYKQQMRRDFPESELKPLDHILSLKYRGEYDAIGAYEDDALVAYALSFRPKGSRVALLDYLAVRESMRGQGIGKELIASLRRHYAPLLDVLMIECEYPPAAPDEAFACNRIEFYKRGGALLTDVRIELFGVDFNILALPCGQRPIEELREADWAEQMLFLYRRMIPSAYYEKNVKLLCR